MQELKVLFKEIEDVKAFCDICGKYDFDVDLYTGKYVVNAKSIMGIFSLNLSKPICMKADCSDGSSFLQEIEPFLV